MYLKKAFSAERENLPLMNEWVRESISACRSADHVDNGNAQIAVGEVLQNCIRYAFEENKASGNVTIIVADLTLGIAITILDDAPVSDPALWVSDKDEEEGGHGLKIIASAASGVSFSSGDGNKAFLCFLDDRLTFNASEAVFLATLINANVVSVSLTDFLQSTKSQFLPDQFQLLLSCASQIEAYEKEQKRFPTYHNSSHYRDVLVSCQYLIGLGKVQVNWEMSFLLAALLHDYKHPGIKAETDLEGYSSIESQTMAFICNDFPELSDNKTLMRQIECLILGTEEKQIERLQKEGFSNSIESEMQHLFNACDVASSMVPFMGFDNANKLVLEGDLVQTATELYESFKETLVDRFRGTPFFDMHQKVIDI